MNILVTKKTHFAFSTPVYQDTLFTEIPINQRVKANLLHNKYVAIWKASEVYALINNPLSLQWRIIYFYIFFFSFLFFLSQGVLASINPRAPNTSLANDSPPMAIRKPIKFQVNPAVSRDDIRLSSVTCITDDSHERRIYPYPWSWTMNKAKSHRWLFKYSEHIKGKSLGTLDLRLDIFVFEYN